jgi:hypothetical protein
MNEKIYWEPVSRTESMVIIRQISTDLLFAWTKRDGWFLLPDNYKI